jgi:predicted RecA/RadA family phage recombinase
MNNFIKPGNICTFTAPAGGVLSGNGYVIGSLFVVSSNNAAAGAQFEGWAEGVFSLPKAATAWTEGQLLYWDTANNNVVTAPSATARRIGNAEGIGGAAAADPTGRVRLAGNPDPVNVA